MVILLAFLFLISGKAESGKDTVANMLMKNSNVGTNCNYHIANSVKKIAKESFGWDGKKDEKGRALLQLIGDGGRQYDPDIWINKFKDGLDNMLSMYDKKDLMIVVPDVRYKNEVKKLLDWGKQNDVNVLTMRVTRPNHENALTEEQRANSSEVDLDDWGFWDVEIINDSTMQALEVAVLNTMEVLGIDY